MSEREHDTVWDRTRLEAPHTQPDKAQRVRRMFDAIAPTYELVNTLASAGRDRYWRREMVRVTAVRPEDVLLDLACGTGDVARAFASGDPRPTTIIAADFSRAMLQLARKRPAAGTLFTQADALHLPLANGCVTIVSCAFGIRNFQNLGAGLSEIHRVLAPGGRAVILEFTIPSMAIFRHLYRFYVGRVLPALAWLVSRDHTGAYRYLHKSVLSFPSRVEIVSSLKTAGFSDIVVRPLSWGIVTIYLAGKAGI
jgi:demethylmenaquinone methyltransferase/2-methoxy-6-polyprenyl-1,4-benzoquinol methylase